ncbi:hypothetical protein Q31b_30080 [Novipirellula aureliae]|uniref:Uncharacterized protein n=1 Tax=Novipirellula aureliae TaxID=2527966 RepID=A0A5C6DY75_9BACT|nr:hypothetical protein Q31b_30080 [Novipirellula aureliae]
MHAGEKRGLPFCRAEDAIGFRPWASIHGDADHRFATTVNVQFPYDRVDDCDARCSD